MRRLALALLLFLAIPADGGAQVARELHVTVVSCTTARTALVGQNLRRRELRLWNLGTVTVFVNGTMSGRTPVSTANGWAIHAASAGSAFQAQFHALSLINFGGQLECVGNGATSDVQIMELFE